MAQRRLAYPGTMLQNMELIKKNQASYAGGMNSDFPAQELADNEVSEFFNMFGLGKYAVGRTGSRLLSEVSLPVITGVNVRCSKSGSIVTIEDYDANVHKDGYYIVLPSGLHDQIRDVNASTGTFISSVSGDEPYTVHATLHEQVWGLCFNDSTGKIVVHIGQRLFFIRNDFSSGYTEIIAAGRADGEAIAESRTSFDIDDDVIIAYNAAGIFKLFMDDDSGYYAKINSGQPSRRIYEDVRAEKTGYGRNRIYTLMGIVGPGCVYGNRNTAGVKVDFESAPVLLDAEHKDASIQYSGLAVGPGFKTYQELASANSVCTNVTAGTPKYRDYSNGSFKIAMNGLTARDIVGDFSSCVTMNDVATIIQASLRFFFNDAQCYYRADAVGDPHLYINAGVKGGGIVGYISEPATGTTITALLKMKYANSAVINTVKVDQSQIVLGMSPDSARATHYGMYGSEDAVNKTLSDGTIIANNPDLLVWEKDIPIIKVFRASYADNTPIIQTVAARFGAAGPSLFAKEDIGSSILYATGGVASIIAISYFDTVEYVFKDDLESQASYAARTYSRPTPFYKEPVAIGAKKISRGYQLGSTVYLDNTNYGDDFNVESESDVGKILFLEDGSIRHIIGVDVDSHTLTVHEAIDFGNPSDAPEDWQAFAWDPVRVVDAPLTGTNKYNCKKIAINKPVTGAYPPYPTEATVTLMGGPKFDASDEGRKIRLIRVNHDIDVLIKTYLTPTTVVIKADIEFIDFIPEWLGITGYVHEKALPRVFNDFITDDILTAYSNDPAYTLQTRFFIPLPSSPIGALGQSFMFVAEENTGKIAYSEMPATREYIVGFYHPTYQADSGIDDIITHLRAYPDRMIAFGRKSTWGTNTSAMTSIKTPEIGEAVFTVPSFSIIDQYGLIHVGSIQDIGIGQSIMIGHDGGVRAFDGSQYSAVNFAENRAWKALRTLHTQIMSSYDPHGGYMIFGANIVSTDTYNAVNMTEGLCYRLAVLPSQGWLWSRWGGEAMVSPYPNTGGIRIDNAVDMPMQVMLDERTGKWHQINTFAGPSGSGLEETFTDKDDTEILCSVKGPRHSGAKQTDLLEHMESHADINAPVTANVFGEGTISISASGTVVTLDGSTFPSDIGLGYQIAIDTDGSIENRRVLTRDSDTQLTLYSASTKKNRTGMGFIVIGPTFRIGFTVTTNIYVDNNRVYSAKTVDQPVDGDYVYDRKINSKMIQNEYVMSTSYFTFGDCEVIYVSRDTAGHTAMENRDTTETGQQRLYGEGLLWLTRGR